MGKLVGVECEGVIPSTTGTDVVVVCDVSVESDEKKGGILIRKSY